MFDAPGKATAWGLVGCVLCTVAAHLGLGWILGITLFCALAGCFNG